MLLGGWTSSSITSYGGSEKGEGISLCVKQIVYPGRWMVFDHVYRRTMAEKTCLKEHFTLKSTSQVIRVPHTTTHTSCHLALPGPWIGNFTDKVYPFFLINKNKNGSQRREDRKYCFLKEVFRNISHLPMLGSVLLWADGSPGQQWVCSSRNSAT